MNIPTPYVWTYQPQLGIGAGASQDYSTKIHWLSAGPQTIERIRDINENRNRILVHQAQITETPRRVINPPTWPSSLLLHPQPSLSNINISPSELTTFAKAYDNAQLAGGKMILPYVGKSFKGNGMQLNEYAVGSHPNVRSEGVSQLAGGELFNSNANVISIIQEPSKPRYGGLGSYQFLKEFVPEVNFQPYSGEPDSYPLHYIFNYNIKKDAVDNYS